MKSAWLLFGLAACTSTKSAPPCGETIAEYCDSGGLQSGACGPPSQFVVYWVNTGYSCGRSTCGDYTEIGYGGGNDSDHYELIYRGDSLTKVVVFPYLGNPYCLASDGTPVTYDPLTDCVPAGSCNEPCTLTQSTCTTNIHCGATTMTMCDGSVQHFSGCSCQAPNLVCDGQKLGACPADAGAD